MRKLRFLSLIALLGLTFSVNAWAENIPEPSFNIVGKKMAVGQKQGDTYRVIKLVRFASRDQDTRSLVSGDAVRYSLTSDDGVTISTSTTSGDGAIAGIVCTTIQSCDNSSTRAQDDAFRRNWGWIVVHGPTTALVTAGGTNNHAAGDPWILSTDEARITTLQTVTLSTASSLVYNGAHLDAMHLRQAKAAARAGGFFMDAVGASDTTADVYVELE